jgi:hypothetical protein
MTRPNDRSRGCLRLFVIDCKIALGCPERGFVHFIIPRISKQLILESASVRTSNDEDSLRFAVGSDRCRLPRFGGSQR